VKELEGEDFHQALIDKFLEEVSEYNESHDLSN
jgi:predicted house-cleaning noncanonical NTP pyrophosphatase (MazG superfamily)